MIRIPKAHRFVPCAATVLTLTVAVTLRVEHSCSQDIRPPVQSSPAPFYLHPEILSVRDSAPLREKKTEANAVTAAVACSASSVAGDCKHGRRRWTVRNDSNKNSRQQSLQY
jgi:hypothetical protein